MVGEKKNTSETAARKSGGLVIYPILIGIYPLLAILAQNITQIQLNSGFRALIASLVFCLAVFLFVRLFLHNWHKAGLATFIFLVLFFSYGHIYQLLKDFKPFGFELAHHRYFVPVWILLFGCGLWLAWRGIHHPEKLTRPLNILSGLLVLVAVGQIGIYYFNLSRYQPPSVSSDPQAAQATAPENAPDVYYIILDGYSRHDVIQNYYGYDNTPFIKSLRELGFYVPDCAQSNYLHTLYSMASSLSMDYLVNPDGSVYLGTGGIDFAKYTQANRNAKVFGLFRKMGYKIIAFDAGYEVINITTADIYYDIKSSWKPGSPFQLTAFERLFIDSSMVRVIFDSDNPKLRKALNPVRPPEQIVYDRTLFQLGQLEKIPGIPGKKFTYVHIQGPHDPYVFTPSGEFFNSPDDFSGYVPEVQYLNRRLLEIIPALISNSSVPPIILIQGDHGWSIPYRSPILSAYYLPGIKQDDLYPSISPVNSFRLVFNTYFGTNYPLLEDHTYFALDDKPSERLEKPQTCAPVIQP